MNYGKCEFCLREAVVGGETPMCKICLGRVDAPTNKKKTAYDDSLERGFSDGQGSGDAIRLQRPINEEERFRKLTAIAGEHFDDFFIVVRCKDGMIYRCSDQNWTLGALSRYAVEVQMRDNFNLFNDIREGN